MKKGRIASIDYGLARLGLAISDESRIIATGIGIVEAHKKNSQETIQRLLAALKAYNPQTIVIGNPLHLNGKMSFLADEVKHFIMLLQPHVTCPIILWDERLTTLQAERTLMESGMNRKKRAKHVDTLAAVIILQSYLEHLSLQATD